MVDGANSISSSIHDTVDEWFFKTTVNPNNPNVQQVRGQNIIANEIAGETIHPGGAEAYAMTKGLVSALPGVGMIMDLEALTDTNNSVSTRAMAGMSFGLGVMGVLSSAAAAEGRMCNLFCFTEGTQIVVGAEFIEDNVFVDYVTVNIEDIEVGDLVYSYDTVTEIVSQQEVTETFVRESDHLNYLTIVDEDGNEQVIETTDSHPLWVVTDSPDLERAARSVVDENDVILYHENLESNLNGFWVEAKDLCEGDVFLGANGELSTLVTSERVVFPDGIKVYNFTVEGNHDYFVIAEIDEFGQTCILVHNGCGSYTIFFNNGMKYHGKGDRARALASARRIEEMERKRGNIVKSTHIDWKSAPNDRQSFIDEAKRIEDDGGIGKGDKRNYNLINSPGVLLQKIGWRR